ncbi:MAG: DUF2312 domain-containing protein [Rickettsiaceae bacterium]|nr:DUF2312 domain-containing protein [Rickettsiaceae bacterium]
MSEVIAVDQLKQFIDRLERLEEDKANLGEDIKEVLNEAKLNGYDTKIMKQILKIKKADKDKLAEQEAILDLYRRALNV